MKSAHTTLCSYYREEIGVATNIVSCSLLRWRPHIYIAEGSSIWSIIHHRDTKMEVCLGQTITHCHTPFFSSTEMFPMFIPFCMWFSTTHYQRYFMLFRKRMMLWWFSVHLLYFPPPTVALFVAASPGFVINTMMEMPWLPMCEY